MPSKIRHFYGVSSSSYIADLRQRKRLSNMPNKISFELSTSMLNQLDVVRKLNDVQNRSEAIRTAIKEYIQRETQRVQIAKFLDQLARGEMPDYLRDNHIDARKKKDLDSVEQLLKNSI